MSRFGGKRNTSDLLSKVTSQLKGEKVKAANEDDGLGDYLSSLGRKTSASQPQWDKFGDEDLSLSSEDGRPGHSKEAPKVNKFLKKKPAPAKEEIKTSTKTDSVAASKIGALNKVSAYADKYSKKPTKSELMKFSDSDLDDLSAMSLDDDVMASVKQPIKAPAKKTPPPKKTRAPSPEMISDDSDLSMGGSKFMKKPTQAPSYVLSDDDSFGNTGNRFMKKKKKKEEHIDEEIDREEEEEKPAKVISPKPTAKKKKDMFSLRSADRYSSQVVLDSEDESLQNFIEGLSPVNSPKRSPQRSPMRSPSRSPSPPTSPARTPKVMSVAEILSDIAVLLSSSSQGILKTPRTPRTPTMEYISEEDESVVDSMRESVSSEGSFNLNVMDVASLDDAMFQPEPTPRKPPTGKAKDDKKAKVEAKPSTSTSSFRTTYTSKSTKSTPKSSSFTSKEPSDIFSSLGLQSVDDLMGFNDDDDDADEVKTEPYDSDTPSRPTTPLRSILSPSPRPLTPRSSRSRVRLSLSDVREVGGSSGSRSPSPEVIQSSRTRSASIAYSEDFDDESVRTETVKTEDNEDSDRTLSPPPRSRQPSYSEFSDDYTATSTSSPRRRSSRLSRMSSHDSTYSDTFSDRSSRSPSPDSTPRPRKKPSTRSTEVQTGLNVGDMIYQWNQNVESIPLSYPLGAASTSYREPALISTQVVGAQTLEAMTTFSPSVLALNELLRSHLEMTRNFLETQRRLHADLAATTYPDYHYTTLEDTHKYIQQNKRKTLTFDQALRQVKKEMGLK